MLHIYINENEKNPLVQPEKEKSNFLFNETFNIQDMYPKDELYIGQVILS
jgi:hypothetical protein